MSIAGAVVVSSPLAISEKAFQASVIELAELHGWMVMHQRPALTQSGRWSTAISGTPGFPDLVLAKRGRLILAELKTEKGKLSPHQLAWAKVLEGSQGGEQLGPQTFLYFVWRPRDWPAIEALLTS